MYMKFYWLIVIVFVGSCVNPSTGTYVLVDQDRTETARVPIRIQLYSNPSYFNFSQSIHLNGGKNETKMLFRLSNADNHIKASITGLEPALNKESRFIFCDSAVALDSKLYVLCQHPEDIEYGEIKLCVKNGSQVCGLRYGGGSIAIYLHNGDLGLQDSIFNLLVGNTTDQTDLDCSE